MAHSITELAASLQIPANAIEARGNQIVKVDPSRLTTSPKGRVVLVTAMTPTPAGEGKTTTVVGLVDGLKRLKANVVGALREPSLGPLFGHKGGAVGGGRSQVVPADSINLHFTGDLHAVTSAHNLLSAIVDNHLYFQNQPPLDLQRINWGSVLDMNDRALRQAEVGREPESVKRGINRVSRTDITAASEVMAVLCLSRDVEDLRRRLDRILVGFSKDGEPITAGTLKAGGAMAAVLLEATRPNLVQSLEGSPFFIHGGPFANIAQGTSSLIATQAARSVADIVVTEAGFAFDLGGVKFLDLKARSGGFRPADIVLVITVRALRHHGGADFKAGPNVEAVSKGLANIKAHLRAMKNLGLRAPLLAINRFPGDSAEELTCIKDFATSEGTTAVENSAFSQGGAGAEELAAALLKRLREHPEDSPEYTAPYQDSDSIPTKIESLSHKIFGAQGVTLSEAAQRDLRDVEQMQMSHLPICIAKTHLSISDDKKILGQPAPFTLQVTRLRPSLGPGFIVALCGDILTMPGLPKEPAAAAVDIQREPDGTWKIIGLR